jgi:hypothetical protein
MKSLSRRMFLGASAGAVSALSRPGTALAAPAQQKCVVDYRALPVQPAYLTVDCASRRNFQLYRKNTDYLGLAGAVSMTSVRGRQGTFEGGNLFLFPWLKPKGQGLARLWGAVAPTSATAYMSAGPIPNAALPVEEYFCNFVLEAPATLFIGFQVDVPYSKLESRFDWFTTVDKLADGKGVGIDWTSSNLNNGWFAGSRFIPKTDQCGGSTWRKLIIAGLNQAASAAAC